LIFNVQFQQLINHQRLRFEENEILVNIFFFFDFRNERLKNGINEVEKFDNHTFLGILKGLRNLNKQIKDKEKKKIVFQI